MHERNPFPSIADVFYLATYLLLSTGLILMVRSRRRRDGDSGAVLDALIFTSGFGALSWIYLIQPYVDADMGMLSKLTSIAYPIGDILMLCVLVRLVFGGGTRNTAVRLLVIGRNRCLRGRLRVRVDSTARFVESRWSHGPWLGAVLRLLGCRGAAPRNARVDGGKTVATSPSESDHLDGS